MKKITKNTILPIWVHINTVKQVVWTYTDISLYSVWCCFSIWDHFAAFSAFGVMGKAENSFWDNFGKNSQKSPKNRGNCQKYREFGWKTPLFSPKIEMTSPTPVHHQNYTNFTWIHLIFGSFPPLHPKTVFGLEVKWDVCLHSSQTSIA